MDEEQTEIVLKELERRRMEILALKKFVKTVEFASCDSHSGLYCEDEFCANVVIPKALRELRMPGW